MVCKTNFLQKPPVNKGQLICTGCNMEFLSYKHNTKFCSDECRIQSRRKRAKHEREARTCKVCGTGLTAGSRLGFCSKTCTTVFRMEQKYKGEEGKDFIVCPICKTRTKQITPNHAKMHGFVSIAEMKKSLKLTNTVCDAKKLLSAGERNPGFNHGGKLSAWSKNFIGGYDEAKHKQRVVDHKELIRKSPEKFKFNFLYWENMFPDTPEQAKAEYIKFQTRSLDWFTEKYGESEGNRRHQLKTERWVSTMNDKSVAELGDINSRKIRKSACFFSKAEKELFETLKKTVPSLTEQFSLCRDTSVDNKKFYVYDMVSDKKIIEYNGDFWHSNPVFYDSTFISPYTKKTQCEILCRDADKLNLAKTAGYEVLVIWENEYHANKNKVIEKCITFLTQ